MPDNKNYNDVDSILSSFFGSSSLNLNGSKKAAEEAEKFLSDLEKKQKVQSKKLDKTVSKIDNVKMNASIQSELDALTKNLESDGLVSASSQKVNTAADAEKRKSPRR